MKHPSAVIKSAWVAFCVFGVVAYGYIRWDRQKVEPFNKRALTAEEIAQAQTGGNVLGSGATEIVLFTRYSCPYCRSMSQRLDSLLAISGDKYSVRVRHLVHPADATAYTTALASECAADQGKFQEFHKSAFRLWGPPLSSENLSRIARSVGVADSLAFDECLSSQRLESHIERDRQAADQLRITGVPALVAGNNLLVGSPTIDELQRMLP